MSSINSVRNLQMLNFSKKNKEIKKLKKKTKNLWPRICIYTYHSQMCYDWAKAQNTH